MRIHTRVSYTEASRGHRVSSLCSPVIPLKCCLSTSLVLLFSQEGWMSENLRNLLSSTHHGAGVIWVDRCLDPKTRCHNWTASTQPLSYTCSPTAILKTSYNGCPEISSGNFSLIFSGFYSFMFCIIGKTSQNLALPVLLNKNVSPSVVMI